MPRAGCALPAKCVYLHTHMITLRASTGIPFYRQIVDQVADAVRSGRLPPGSRLPSVRELAASLSVSLITVRRAYADLESAGLVVRRQGQGTFVAEDVGEAARRRARRDAREALGVAVDRALALGLEEAEVLAAVRELLEARRKP